MDESIIAHLEEVHYQITSEGLDRQTFKGISNLVGLEHIPAGKVPMTSSTRYRAETLIAIESILDYLPGVTVQERLGVVYVGGIPAKLLMHDINKIWKTSKIAKYMLVSNTSRGFAFYSFFAIEILYLLKALLLHTKARSSNSILKDLCSKLEADTWLRNLGTDDLPPAPPLPMDMSALGQLNVPLLEMQRNFLAYYQSSITRYNLRGTMLAAKPGSGKTITALALSLAVKSELTIIIAPKNAILSVWVKTLDTFFKRPQRHWDSVTGTKPDTNVDYLIFHYEALDRAISIASKVSNRKVTIILDESHNLNELGSARTKYYIKLCRDSKASNILPMSGTPIKNAGAEIRPLLMTIDPLYHDLVDVRFAKIFGVSGGSDLVADILANRIGIATYLPPKTTMDVNDRLEVDVPISFKDAEQYTLESISKEMKDYIVERIAFYSNRRVEYETRFWLAIDQIKAILSAPTDAKALARYITIVTKLHKSFSMLVDKDIMIEANTIESEVIMPNLPNDLKREFKAVKSVFKYVSLTIRGEALGRILTRRRIDCFKAMVPHCELEKIINTSEKKTLIFASYISVVDEIAKYCKSKGFKPIIVHGETSQNLKGILQRFKSDPKCNPLIATYDSLSTAVPIIEANTVVLFNSPFRSYIREQATARVDRIGQDQLVRVVSLILDTGDKPNISERSKQLLEWSKTQVSLLLGDTFYDLEDSTINEV